MRLVERMTLDPMRCLGCARGNTPDEDGNIGPFIDMEMEIGWNDHAYICPLCATQVGALADMIAPDEYKDLERRIKERDAAIFDLEAQLGQAKSRLKKTQQRLLRV